MKKLIRTYLPKASRGGQRRLIAKARSSRNGARTAALSPALAKKASKQIASRVGTAHAASLPTRKDVKSVKRKIVALSAKARPTPQLRTSLSAAPKGDIDKTVTATVRSTTQAKPGYQIQIAASDSRNKALEMLKKAKSKNRKLLGSTTIFTQEVTKNGTTLYRARFAGFSSKRSATRACRILKRQRYACLALDG